MRMDQEDTRTMHCVVPSGADLVKIAPDLTTWTALMAHSTDAEQNLKQANAEQRYTVTRADLPLSCPMPDTHLWHSHPRVYLPIEKTGEAKCEYCGAEYVLQK